MLSYDDIEERIKEHAEDPFHSGRLPNATHVHEEKNPTCGDVVRVQLALDSDGRIKDCAFIGTGCEISRASASMLMEEIYGKSVSDVKKFSAEDMMRLYGAPLLPLRRRCCLLSWKALQSAVYSPVT
jgi:nitrogen fixation NifU-like protein